MGKEKQEEQKINPAPEKEVKEEKKGDVKEEKTEKPTKEKKVSKWTKIVCDKCHESKTITNEKKNSLGKKRYVCRKCSGISKTK